MPYELAQWKISYIYGDGYHLSHKLRFDSKNGLADLTCCFNEIWPLHILFFIFE